MALERGGARSSRYPGEREMAARALSRTGPGPIGLPPPCRSSTSTRRSSPTSCKRGRKTATIRLGDKSHKYRKNQAVLVTIGYQHSPREKIFEAVIDAGRGQARHATSRRATSSTTTPSSAATRR